MGTKGIPCPQMAHVEYMHDQLQHLTKSTSFYEPTHRQDLLLIPFMQFLQCTGMHRKTLVFQALGFCSLISSSQWVTYGGRLYYNAWLAYIGFSPQSPGREPLCGGQISIRLSAV